MIAHRPWIQAPLVDGIYRTFTPERTAYFDQFRREYGAVRAAEGRGSGDPAYYRALPYQDISGRESENWRIRAASFDTFLEKVLRPRAPENVLDLGAGNGWLSNRIAGQVQQVAAIDVFLDDRDGLAAIRRYSNAINIALVEAEFDALPFSAESVDLVVFNASFHYAVDFVTTLREALRVLRREGAVVILDTPIYRDASSGRAMVLEREQQFLRSFGFASNSVPSQGFLTFDGIEQLGQGIGIQWTMHRPNYGFGWAIKPLRAKLRGRREPATFGVLVGTRP